MTPQSPSGPEPDGTGAEPAPEWWEDPGLPWAHKPSRADIVCLSALGVVGVYGLVMLPLRPVMLGLAPHVLGSLGYRTGFIMTGALAAVGDRWWPLVLLLGTLMVVKFHWVYWWAGKLWGHEILDVFAKNKSERTKRRYDRAWELTHRYDTIAILLTFLPIPIPAGVVFAAVGAAGTSLRKFLTLCILGSLVTTAGYLYLGYRIGEPAVQVMDVYGRYLWIVTIVILVGMVVLAWWRGRKGAAASAGNEKGTS